MCVFTAEKLKIIKIKREKLCGARKNSNYFEWILVLKWPLACKKSPNDEEKYEKSVEEQEAFASRKIILLRT